MSAVQAAAIALVLTTWAMPLHAHHSFVAEFDQTKPVTLRGVVAKMEWINPHTWLHIDVTRPDGKVERWMIEGGAPNALLRRGLTKNSLLPQTAVVVRGFQANDGSHKANGQSITFADGRKALMGSSGPGVPEFPR
jgi:hypothetical protein